MRLYKIIIVCFFLLFINAVEASAQESQTITLADNGRTITLNVNETFLLNLGEGYDWDITIDDQTIFSRVVNVLVVRGAQGIYIAHRPGNATLTAVGSPECLKSQPPCGRPSILFKIFVVVPGQEQVPGTSGFEGLAVISAILAAIIIRRR
ncbi:MAG: hypothetical protein Q7J35_16190 [Candidatus Methanoperedens sp.]|nr:hypothetical protein [Candidatus Methanoperedens sp.]